MDGASDEANEEYLVQPSLVDSLLLFDSHTLFIYKEDVCKGIVNFENLSNWHHLFFLQPQPSSFQNSIILSMLHL